MSNIRPKTLSRLADKGVLEYLLMPGSNHRRYKVSSNTARLSENKKPGFFKKPGFWHLTGTSTIKTYAVEWVIAN